MTTIKEHDWNHTRKCRWIHLRHVQYCDTSIWCSVHKTSYHILFPRKSIRSVFLASRLQFIVLLSYYQIPPPGVDTPDLGHTFLSTSFLPLSSVSQSCRHEGTGTVPHVQPQCRSDEGGLPWSTLHGLFRDRSYSEMLWIRHQCSVSCVQRPLRYVRRAELPSNEVSAADNKSLCVLSLIDVEDALIPSRSRPDRVSECSVGKLWDTLKLIVAVVDEAMSYWWSYKKHMNGEMCYWRLWPWR